MFKLLVIMAPALAICASFDPIIVSSKKDIRQSLITSNVEIISEQKIENNISSEVVDLLRPISGMNISQTGGPGSPVSIFIRGAESRHTVVLIDGVRANDPSDIGASFNMSALSSLDIEKIEIIKGPQSLLYGSDAVGGVINIITKKAEAGGEASLGLGVQKELSNSLTTYGKNNVFYLNTFYNESEVISALKSDKEKDKSENKGATLNYAHVFGNLEGEWQVKYLDSFVEFDNAFGDSTIPHSESLTQIYSQKLQLNDLKLNTSHLKSDRFSRFSATTAITYSGSRTTNEMTYNLSSKNSKVLIGLSHEYFTYEQSGQDEFKANRYGAFIDNVTKLNSYIVSGGARLTKHEDFNNFTSFNFGFGKNLPNRKQIKVNYATGFKSPTLYQLNTFEPGVFETFGNKKLNPEKSRSVEFTFLSLTPIGYQVSIFDTSIDDFITYNSGTSTFENAKGLRSYGIDMSLNQNIGKFILSEGLLLNKAHDSSRKYALKRPEQKVNFNGLYKFNDNNTFNFNWYWVSSQVDFGDVFIKAYDITNITFTHMVRSIRIKLGLRNLFNKQYEESANYNTLGFNTYIKAEYRY